MRRHDVSWIYDVDFERIADTPGLVAFAGGTRAHDMQVRLKYAGIDAAIISDVAQAIGAVADEAAGDTFYAVANYTAFPPLVKELDGLKDDDASSIVSHAVTRADGSAVPTDIAPVELSRPCASSTCIPMRSTSTPTAATLSRSNAAAPGAAFPCVWTKSHGRDARPDRRDIVMMGGGSDRDQLAVAHELLAQKDKVAAYVEDGGTLLAICGGYQLLGRSYYMGEDRIEGLGVIAAETVRGSDRLIGNVAVKTDLAPEPLSDSRTTAAARFWTSMPRRSERPSSRAPATTATMALRV